MLQQTALSKTAREKKPHQQDKYEGELNSKTKQRHGKGIYHFSNRYFEYEGNYQNNVREGPGVLKLANGTGIEANFVGGEIQGNVKATYADGSKYVGEMVEGQRCGYGEFTSDFEKYKGSWQSNKKHGQGQYENTSFKVVGQFSENKLNGEATVTTWDSEFKGSFKEDKKDGYGELIDQTEGMQYKGFYKEGLKDGKGKFTYLRSGYEYDGEFKQDQPTLVANEFEVKVSFTKTEEGEQKKSEFAVVPVLEYELEGDPFNLEVRHYETQIRVCYQGPLQLDPVQPTADEIDKQVKAWQEANKKNKNPPPMPDFNQPRMIKPAIVTVDNESGRQLTIELFQVVEGKEDRKMQVDYRKDILARRAQIEAIKKDNAKKNEEEADKKKPGKKEGKGAGQPELKVNLYKQEMADSAKRLRIRNKQGRANVDDLQFPDDFPVGKYYFLISSVSRQCYGQPAPLKLEMLVNSKGTAAAKATKKK